MLKSFRWVLPVLVLVLAGCAVNPATGKRQFNFVSEADEVRIGTESDKAFRRQFGVYKDAKLQAYVDEIGQRVAKRSGRPELAYHFVVLDSPMINAFALPGGFVYVTRGVLQQMNSEAELAFVLGHEVSHVAAKHGAQRLSQMQSINLVFSAAEILLGNESKDWSGVAGQVVGLAVQGYGREQEFEADLLGVDAAGLSQYSVEEGAAFLETLRRQEKSDPTWLETMLGSHPPTKERIRRVQKRIAALEEKGAVVKRDVFLRWIEGMAVSDDPYMGTLSETGLYENKYFGVSLPLGAGWTATMPLDDSVAEFNLEGGASARFRVFDTPKGERLSAFLLTGQEPVSFRHGSMADGQVMKSRSRNNEGEMAYYFKGKNKVYVFSFSIPFSDLEMVSDLDDRMGRLAVLDTDKTFLAKRLRLVEVGPADTLSSIAEKWMDGDDKEARLAAYNGLALGEMVLPGDLLKLP